MSYGDCEVLVIGAGLGGMTSAILLGQMGIETTLIERSVKAGGLLRSYSRQGVDCPVGVHYFGPAGKGEVLRQFFDILGVTEKLKLKRLGAQGILERYIFDDFTFELPSTIHNFGEALLRFCPDDKAAVRTIATTLATMSEGLQFDESGKLQSSPFSFAGIDQSMNEFLTSAGCSELLHRLLTVHGFWTGLPMDQCPAYLILYTLAALLRSPWELGCTGAEMADACAEQAVSKGARLILADPVVEILIDGGQACGVRLQSGRIIRCKKIVAGIHPKLVLPLLPDDAVTENYRRGLMQLPETPGALCVHLLVPAAQVPEYGHNTFRIHRVNRGRIEGIFMRVRASERPGLNLLTLIGGSDYQQWAPWHKTATGRRGDAYLRVKTSAAEAMIDVAKDVLGTFKDYQIIDVATPLSMRDWAASPEGGLYGLMRSVSTDLQFAVLTRMPIRSLFLVGQNAIAPGLLGVTLSVLRAVGEVAGRSRFQKFLAEKLRERPSS